MSKKEGQNLMLARRDGLALVPINEYGIDLIEKLPRNDLIQIELKFLRNPKFSALYWVLIDVVYPNLNNYLYPSRQSFHEALKVMCGVTHEIWLPPGKELVLPTGEVIRIGPGGERVFSPGSIAFNMMDELEFSAYFERVCDLIVFHFLPGVTSLQLRDRVERLVGFQAPRTPAAFQPTKRSVLA